MTGMYSAEKGRFFQLRRTYKDLYGEDNIIYYSSPGRIEIGGNHTDHNNGRILAAAINIDSIAAVSKTDDNKINLYSKELDRKFTVELSSLSRKDYENGTTSAIIRGIASKFVEEGYRIGGFNCCVESRIGIGSGLSSSASIELLIGTILNDLYNNNIITSLKLAQYGQYAENEYFGKPCGLMDQLAIASGGIVFVDFYDWANPTVVKLNVDFSDYGLALVIVNTGGTHANLTDDYASIPEEMKLVARHFYKSSCRLITREHIIDNLAELRSNYGDRAVLRALHFLEENERVLDQTKALKEKDIVKFLLLIKQSGDSSARWLQNIYSIKNYSEQNISLALELTEYFIKEKNSRGACRVHGGGFAGTILSFIEQDILQDYITLMEKAFEENSATVVSIRENGTSRIDPDSLE